MFSKNEYNPEEYWSEVADRIDDRDVHNIMAGDDTPYYRYKRERFLKMLHAVDFDGKKVMELGSGPGGNVKEVLQENPLTVTGVDISDNMIKIASKNVSSDKVNFVKTDGKVIPIEDKKFDIVFSATVLQHNTNEEMMKTILREMCRVSGDKVILFERIEHSMKGNELCMGRTVDYYGDVCREMGFELVETKFINIHFSYMMAGFVRNYLNSKTRKEGQPLNQLSLLLQKVLIPFTKILDRVFPVKRNLGQLVFVRK